MKRLVLVTGGGGYIGSLLVHHLIQRGFKVRLIDTFYFGKGHFKNINSSLELIENDLRHLNSRYLIGVDAIIHLAAISNDPMANFAPRLNYQVNVEATKRLSVMAKKAGIKRFIFASSCSIYHKDRNNEKIFTETDTVSPIEPYSKAKRLAEKYLLSITDRSFAVTIFRMGTVGGYSPRMKFDLVVNTMVKTAITQDKIFIHEGLQFRPLIDIRDVVDIYTIALSVNKNKIGGRIFNLAFANYRIEELAQEIASVMVKIRKKIKIERIKPDHKIKSYRVSTKALLETFNWKPKYSASETAIDLVSSLKMLPVQNFDDPRYYNFAHTKNILTRLEQELSYEKHRADRS